MKTLKFVIVVAIFVTSAVSKAFVVSDSEQCLNPEKQHNSEMALYRFQQVSPKLTRAAGKIDALEDQPIAFAIDVAAGTAVRATKSGVETLQDGSDEVYTIASFALNTPQCAGSSNELSDGVNCIIQLPNKTITIAIVSNNYIGTYVVAGVYSVATHILGGVEGLTAPLARELQQEHNIHKNRLFSVPFAIIGLVMRGLHRLAEVIFYDTRPIICNFLANKGKFPELKELLDPGPYMK